MPILNRQSINNDILLNAVIKSDSCIIFKDLLENYLFKFELNYLNNVFLNILE